MGDRPSESRWKGVSILVVALVLALAGVGCSADVDPSVADADVGAEDVGVPPDAASRAPDASALDASPPDAHVADAQPADPVPPPSVVACMKSKPYVEQTCTPTVVKGWPHPAQRCQYTSPIGTLTVNVADPPATRVAIWILDAARSVPSVAALEKADPPHFLEVLQIMAVDVMLQSGRIFPLSGVVGEAMSGTQYIGYPFTDGVADGCPPSEPHCYCRINSLTRAMYCAYRGANGLEKESTCRTRVGYAMGDTAAWYAECVDNHSSSWSAPDNAHFVAKLWALLHAAGISAKPTGAEVTAALYGQLGFKHGTVASFCP